MKSLLKICIFLFVVFVLDATYISSADTDALKLEQLEISFNIIVKAYPKSRYIRSAGSMISGFFRCTTARNILNDENPLRYEKFAAYSLLGFSSLRYFDGIKGLLSKSSIEHFLLEFRELKKAEDKLIYGERLLNKIAKAGRKDRLYHSFLRGASSMVYFYLYFKDKDKYKKYLVSGLIYTGFAALNLFTRSKPEKAWKSYKEKKIKKIENGKTLNTHFYISHEYKGFRTGFLMTF